tara:strand:- start:543 stop:2759 length:2217 start_codon:yes stop_codon:yes gene_type:complete
MAYSKKNMKVDSDDSRELVNIIDSHINDSLGFISTETQLERATALEYYLREPYGNEVEGRSQIVTGEVAEVVDGALPQVMKVFTTNSKAVEFEPVNAGDGALAEQVTAYVNHIFYKDNNGFEIMHDWFKDGLLQKVGVVKAYWNDKKDVTTEKYENLTEDELAMLMQDEEIEVVEQEEVEEIIEQDPQPMIDPQTGQPPVDPMTGQPMMDEMGMPMMMEVPPIVNIYYNVKCKKTKDFSKVKIENVAPEEFLIDKRATTIEDAEFVAQRSLVTRSDLIAMGYDPKVVETLSTGDTLDFTPERTARFGAGEEPFGTNNSDDESMERVEYYECYVRTDLDEDGIAELHRVCYADNQVLMHEECDYVPFHSVCPIPIPHKFFGQSLADRAMDLQLIKSTVTRQMLDNLYLTNNYRVGAVEGQVNLDDLLTSTAGGVIRIKNPNALVPMTVQSSASQSFPMLEYLDSVQAKRSGVSDAQQGLNPDILSNVTATAVSAMTSASQGKLELIARIFADTGVSSLFKGILALICKYQNKERIIKVHNNFVPMNPREWSTQYNLTVNVGLGTGGKQEQLATMQMILQKQEEVIKGYGLNNPLVNIKQYRDTLAKFVNMAGFKDDSAFLMEVSEEQAMAMAKQAAEAPEKDDPNTAAAKILAEVEREKAQMQMQAKMAQLELEKQKTELKMQKEMLELQQERVEFETEMALKELEFAQKSQSEDSKNKLSESKELINALDKINNIAGM